MNLAESESQDSQPGEFAGQIRGLRLVKGLTQADLAEAAGIGLRTIQAIEAAKHVPQKQTLMRLLDGLGLSPAEREVFLRNYTPRPRHRRVGSGTSSNNLPYWLTSFHGRDSDLKTVCERARVHRLVTISGPGGVGKTRLAVEVARNLSRSFRDGALFVDLVGITEGGLISERIANAFAVSHQEPPHGELIPRLAHMELLLVLDNCEHLLPDCVALSREILTRCPGVTILATTREPLGIDGELLWRLTPFEIPRMGPQNLVDGQTSDAVRLFVDRAGLVADGFSLTAENAPDIVSICSHLDGLPLAIELAAACLRHSSVPQIAQGLAESLSILQSREPLQDGHHTSMQASLSWSYQLLSPGEQAAFRRLGVFRGGWTLNAAQALLPDKPGLAETSDLLFRLVDKALVHLTASRYGSPDRYSMLEIMRAYANDLLVAAGEEHEARATHSSIYAGQVLRFGRIDGPMDSTSRNALISDLDNLNDSLRFLLMEGNDVAAGIQVTAELWPLWDSLGLVNAGLSWLSLAVDLSSEEIDPAIRAEVLLGLGVMAWTQRRVVDARRRLKESLALRIDAKDWRRVARTLSRLGDVERHAGNLARSSSLHKRALIVFQNLRDEPEIAASYMGLANAERRAGNWPLAANHYREALAIYRHSNDTRGEGWALNGLALIHELDGDTAKTQELLTAALDAFTAVSDRRGLMSVRGGLARVAEQQNDALAARQELEEALTYSRDLGDDLFTAQALLRLSKLCLNTGDMVAARNLFRAAKDLIEYAPAGTRTDPMMSTDQNMAGGVLRLLTELQEVLEPTG